MFTSTLRALIVPRRALPILVICTPLVAAQARFSRDPLAVPLGLLLCLSFVLVAPLAWRALFPSDRSVRFAALRLLAYAGIGASPVLLLGYLVPRVTGMGVTFLTGVPSLLISTTFFWVGGWGLGRDIDLEANLKRERARADALAREAERAQLLALRQHLDPHFLFNTLNAIAEWCREDGETAERATLQLSAILRTVLEGIRAPAWPLEQELALVRDLFALHAIRDPNRFRVRWEVPADLPPARVPPLLLLPLAENAMKHGPGAGHLGEVSLEARSQGDTLRIRLENPGPYHPNRTGGGEGLEIARKRLDLAYEGAASLEIDAVNDRTMVTLRVPHRAGPRRNT